MSKTVAFGEIMLRLASPRHERLFQSPALEATFGGGEANVAVSLACLGREASYVTALPPGPLGDGAIGELRKYGVDVSRCKRLPGRMGIYFLENGSNQRASQVVYDREGSSLSLVGADSFDWDAIFQGAGWFHLTGITPAVSAGAAEASLAAVKAAKKAGVAVSIDLNYRKKLWKYGKTAPEVMRGLVSFADVLIANEEDVQLALGIELPEPSPQSTTQSSGLDVSTASLDKAYYRELVSLVKASFPNLEKVAVTLRESHSADRNGWSAVLSGSTGFYESRSYDITDIVDRVGGGDSFAAGLICVLSEDRQREAHALEFAAAASCLKHTIHGDFNLVSRTEVEALLSGDGSGRVKR